MQQNDSGLKDLLAPLERDGSMPEAARELEEEGRKVEEERRKKEAEESAKNRKCEDPAIQREALFAFLVWDYPGYRGLESKEQRLVAYGRLKAELFENFSEAFPEGTKLSRPLSEETLSQYKTFGQQFMERIEQADSVTPNRSVGFFPAFYESCGKYGKKKSFSEFLAILLATPRTLENRTAILRAILGPAQAPVVEGTPHADDDILKLLNTLPQGRETHPGERLVPE